MAFAIVLFGYSNILLDLQFRYVTTVVTFGSSYFDTFEILEQVTGTEPLQRNVGNGF